MRNHKRQNKNIAALIEKCLAGDEAAWNEFFIHTGPIITYVAAQKFRRIGFPHDHQDIENIRQNIHLSLWRDGKLATIREKDKAITWICAYASHSVSNYIRSLKPSDPPYAEIADESILGPDLNPSQVLAQEDTQRRIAQALDSLSYRERAIVKLLYFYEKSHKEISEILNMPLTNVLVSAHRAKSKLKKDLKDFL